MSTPPTAAGDAHGPAGLDVGHRPAEQAAGPRSWWLVIAVAAAHLAFARASVTVPYVFGDEAGYLTKAATFAGLSTDAYSSYYPGYSLWLAPLYVASPHTLVIYPWVQLLNAALAGATAWLLLAIAGILGPSRRPMVRWMAAGALGCYAPALAYSAFALSENLFIPWALLLALLLMQEVAQPARARRMAMALAAAGLVLIHPKGAPVVAALGLGWLAGVWRQGTTARMRVLLWLGASVLVFVPLHVLAEAFFRQRMGYYSDGVSGHYPDAAAVGSQLADVLSAGGARAVALQLAGQLFYLGVGGLGLPLIGLVCRAGPAPTERAYSAFARGALALTLLMTAIFMLDGTRVDGLFYGRYDEGVVLLVMLPVLLRPPRRQVWWLAAAAIAALGLLLVAARGSPLYGEVVQLNVFGAQLWRFLGAVDKEHIDLATWAMAGTLSVVLLGLLSRWQAWPVLVAALFLLAAWQGSSGYLRPDSVANAGRHRIADYVHRKFPHLPCVDYDLHGGEYWQRFNNQVLLLPARMHESVVSPASASEVGRTTQRCSDLVISTTPDMQRYYPGARLLQRESSSQERLWWVPRNLPAAR